MSEDTLARLRARLQQEGLTCIAERGGRTLESRQRGIAPLLTWIAQGEDLRGGSAADVIVGKAAALLYVYMGVAEVYAGTLSEGGLEVLRAHGVREEHGALTKAIVNRAGTGICPMEESVLAISDPAKALAALRATSERLRAQMDKKEGNVPEK